ncbi:amino acid ABC transporter ATP-binding protein [Clostridium cylindrosporum]|uniref:Glutamine transport ATP-binding protein GlnQ n=1 Tax=Clostridium cylindrosporum DSM 605 TaxID=1121307 RepID=A0A0J8D5L2_CLOCY|nr:amino acid ABC transporter ATP-binding protein [Clostridium cylindrosporum]KMT21122.1 glutamine transport ATP-binding protein GlnQ [Clostridium cylindrosporum DSM 605]
MIKIDNINKSFKDLDVLKNASLDVKKGEVISIIGPSGSGKSTFLRCISNLEIIDDGQIIVEGIQTAGIKEDGTKVKPKEARVGLKKVGMVFQSFNLFPHKTVLENVIESPMVVGKIDRKTAIEEAKKLLDKVGLLDKINSYPCQISGGQKQRVAIARALAMKPDIMLFDEPTSALDPELVGEVLKVIKDLAEENMTMLIVTHEMAFAREVSDRIVFFDKGEIIANTAPENIFENPSHPRIKQFIEKMI